MYHQDIWLNKKDYTHAYSTRKGKEKTALTANIHILTTVQTIRVVTRLASAPDYRQSQARTTGFIAISISKCEATHTDLTLQITTVYLVDLASLTIIGTLHAEPIACESGFGTG